MENKYGLTFPQKNILLVEEFFGKSPINTIVGIFEINKDFDKEVCEKAVNKMVEVNDALRLKIFKENDNTYQYVEKYNYFTVDYFDIENEDCKKREELENELTTKPFEILNSPLYYFAIIKTGKDKGHIFVKLHHLVSDAWTFGNVATQLAEYVDMYTNGENSEILKPSYLEFISAENEYISSEKFTKDKMFWEEYLEGFEESVGLKENNNKTLIDAKRYTVRLEEKLNNDIKEFCKENRVSPYTVFMNALAIYLHRVTEKYDFVIGTPVLNRSNFKEKKMMGMFVSTMPVRFKIDEKETFLEMCKKSSSETMSLFRHQKYPYSLMLQDFREKNNVSNNLYEVMISYQNARAEYSDNEKYSSDWIFSTKVQDQFAIHIMDMDETGVLEVHFDYLVDLFEDIEIEYIAKRLFTIIDDGINNNKTIETIEIMPAEEKNKILYEFNDTKVDYPKDKTVIDLFEEQVQKTPDNIAIVFEGKELTYKELNEKANSLAWYLKEEKGVQEKDNIAITLDKSIELMISILGVLKVGACYVPIDTNYTPNRKKYIVEDANCKINIIENFEDENICENTLNIKVFDYNKLDSNIKRNNQYGWNDAVYIMYTSGTTGTPKGTIITNRNIVRLVKNTNYVDFNKDDRIIQTGATVFDACTFEYWGALLNGLSLYMLKKEDLINPEVLKNFLRENKITIMFITTALFNQMVEYDKTIFSTLRVLLTGGEVMSIRHINLALENSSNTKIGNIYGPTENTTFSNFCYLSGKQNKRVPIGQPINNTVNYIVDSKLRLLPLFVEGELVLGGDGVAKGYLNNEELTKEKFVKSPFINNDMLYRTGDISLMLNNGYIDFIGRRDNQVKIRGFRIELDEIKNVVMKFGNINDCYLRIVGENNDKIIVGYVISNKKENINDLNKYLKENLPIYMIPAAFIQIENLPINTNGKIDISKLPIVDITKNDDINIKELSEQEIKVYDIIFEILRLEEKIYYSNFDKYYLDSLKYIGILVRINKEFKTSIKLEDLYNISTVKELITLINNNKENQTDILSSECKLSPVQKGIMAEYLKKSNDITYNVPFELIVDSLDCDKLKKSIETVILNNPSLRTRIYVEDNEFYQIAIDKVIGIKTNKVTKEEYLKIKKDYIKPFDLLRDNLYRIELFLVENKIHVLCDIHHIVFDGISLVKFIQEIKYNYERVNKLNDTRITLCELYSQNVSEEKLNKAKEYYLDKFSGELPVNTLPLDYDRAPTKSIEGDILSHKLGRKSSEKIYEFCNKNRISLNTLCLSAYFVLLSKYMYSEDIILGMASSGRENIKEVDQIGMFVKTIPMRCKINYENKIIDFLSSVNEDCIKSISNSDYTYDMLIKDLNIQKDMSRNPLFDCMFVCQSMGMPNIKIDDKKLIIKELARTTSKFDITCEVLPDNKDIIIKMEYSTKLFNKDSILRLIEHYTNILEYIINNTNKKLYDIEMISEKERDIVINSFNDNKTDFPKEKTVHQIFEENVLLYPNKKAVIFENNYLTYSELNEKANKLARYLIRNGVEQGDIVSIMIDKSIDYLVAAIATLKCNAAYTPVTEDLPCKRAKYMIKNANSKIIITNKEFYREICNIKTIFIDDNNWSNEEGGNLNLYNNSESLLHVIYTSGSTGVPKGNMIKHKGMVRLLLNTNYVDYTSSDVMLASGALTFDISGFEIWGAMMYGMTLHMISKKNVMNIDYYSKYLKDNNITTTFLATPIFHLMVDAKPEMFDDMKSIYVGGETLIPKYTNKLISINKKVKVYNAYGPAEITVICCAMLVDKEFKRDIPLGKIASNNNCYIIDKCNKICPINVPGELVVSGDGMGFGYINRDDLTKERFIYIDGIKDKIYKSGDLTIWNKNGEVRFIGRIDTQVKIRGQRIELSEIENKILSIEGIKEIKVVVQESEKKEKYIIAYYTANKAIDEKSIRNILTDVLPVYMIPYRMVQLEELPLNQNGKVDKNKLPQVELVEIEEIVKPQNYIQSTILNAFKETVENNNIGMTSDFFEIGGDSLSVAKLVMNLQLKDIKLKYGDIFKYRTPIKIYDYISGNKTNKNLTDNIRNIDYSKINNLLSKNTYSCEKVNNVKKIKNVLLLGATGFLGAHILRELCNNNEIENIYCIIRPLNGVNATERLKEKLNYFFDKRTISNIEKKLYVIEGDLVHQETNEMLEGIDVDTIVNSLAYVKHYGDYDLFYNINVGVVRKLVDYSCKKNIQFIHISTLSVSGNIMEGGQIIQKDIKKNTHYSEKDLYIGQNLDNVYVYTKYIAELEILNSMINRNLDAKIMRVGNLTGRYSDGKFQPNVEENAFSNRIKALVNLKIIPENILHLYLELTPIDYTASAVIKLMYTQKDYTVFHIFNDNHAMMKYVNEIFNSIGIKLNVLSKEKTKELISSYMEDSEKAKIIQGIVPDLNENGVLEYNDGTIIDSDFTKKVLSDYGFEWPIITEKYFIKYLKYLDKINFIDLKEAKKCN